MKILIPNNLEINSRSRISQKLKLRNAKKLGSLYEVDENVKIMKDKDVSLIRYYEFEIIKPKDFDFLKSWDEKRQLEKYYKGIIDKLSTLVSKMQYQNRFPLNPYEKKDEMIRAAKLISQSVQILNSDPEDVWNELMKVDF